MVDGLERKMEGKLNVVHLDIQSQDGISVADQLGVRVTPTFIVLDGKGKEIYRKNGGRPDTAAIEAKVAAASAVP